MSEINTEIALLKQEMKQIAKQVDEGFSTNSKEHRELVQLFENAMAKKAGKWVEKVLVWAGASIGLILIGSLMSLILNK